MLQSFRWSWVEAQVDATTELWHSCANRAPAPPRIYSHQEQDRRQSSYDRSLAEVESELRTRATTATERSEIRTRVTAAFGRFSAEALDLPPEAIQLLTGDFLPIASSLARWARSFDPDLGRADIVQACRNAWTACGLQPLFDEEIGLTSSSLGYSLLYPYTDNYLDQPAVSADAKRRFGDRFRRRLRGEPIHASNQHESALWRLVTLIEDQYPRELYPGVHDCLLAIHRAQEDSVAQLSPEPCAARFRSAAELLRLSCAKGGSSVLADACLARGWLTAQESQFAFHWGVLLQLGDDLQDVREDLRSGSATLFTRAVSQGVPLDALAHQLLSFSDCIAGEMECLPHGSRMLKDLLRMSWRSLIVNAVAESHPFFTRQYLSEIERTSPFRFDFLRARRKRLGRRRGLYESLFDTFLEGPDDVPASLPSPTRELVAAFGD